MQPIQAYCFHCRDMRAICQQHGVILRNGAQAIRGHCGACRQEVYRIGRLPEKAPKRRLQSLLKPFFVSFAITFALAYTLVQIGFM